MIFSDFGQKFTSRSGILQLMDDLGKPLPLGVPSYQLGGGNPARVPKAEAVFRREIEALVAHSDDFEQVIARYDSAQGKVAFLTDIASLLSQRYGWNISDKNILLTNGSQTAFFYLFNLFGGTVTCDGKKTKRTIVLPLVPEYIGYADQGIEPDIFVGIPARCEYYDDHTFKYFIDFPALEAYLAEHDEVGALCVSRPSNPTGNVLTDSEICRLESLAAQYNILLFVDNAYGLPFPDIVFTDNATPYWTERIVLGMSLSKIGLPSVRTGIVIADEQVISALSGINAIVSLAPSGIGPTIVGKLIASGEVLDIAANAVKPFYREKSMQAQGWIHEFFAGTQYWLHRSEGAIFLWLYLSDLRISSLDFYVKLKNRGVITVPGEYFFFGFDTGNSLTADKKTNGHYSKCLRLNYSRPEEEVREGLRIISEEYRAFLNA